MFIGNEIRKIKDSDFLRVKWAKKDAAIKMAVCFLNDQAQSRSESKLNGNFPEYLTFDQAEKLFQAIKQLTDGKSVVVIKKMELFHQEINGKPSNKHEAYAENIQLDSSFVSLLVPLMQSVFSNQDIGFKSSSYDEKCAYFKNSIFKSYIESVRVDEKYLPELPTQEAVEFALENKENVEIKFIQEFPILIDIDERSEKVEAEKSSEVEQEDFTDFFDDEFESEKKESESELEIEDEHYEPVLEDLSDNIPDEVPPSQYLHDKKETTTSQLQNSDSKMVLETKMPLPTDDTVYKFPLFELENFAKAKYEPYEEEFITWKLNELKKEFNQQLQQRNKLVEEYSKESITQILLEFEHAELSRISSEIQAEDNRYVLKEKVINESRSQELYERQQKDKTLEKEKTLALEQEKQRYEINIADIKAKFESKHHEMKYMIHQKYFNEAKKQYEEQMLEATNRLEILLQTKLAELAELKLTKKENLFAEKRTLARQIGTQLFRTKQSKLERVKSFLVTEHTLAKKQYLIDEEKKIAQKEREDTLKSNELLRGQIKDLIDSNNRAENKLLDEKEKSLMEKAELIAKLQEKPLVKSEKEINSEPKKKRTTRVATLAFIFLFLAVLLGGTAYYQNQASQAQHQEFQKVVKNQQKTDKEFQSQRAALESQSKKREVESRQKAESDSKKRMSELEKEISSLKSKTSQSQSSSAQLTVEEK